MGRGRGSGMMGIFLLLVLGLVFTIGVIIYGAAMQSVYVETNYTAENTTLIPYETQSAWWMGLSALVLILALGFALWYFWG